MKSVFKSLAVAGLLGACLTGCTPDEEQILPQAEAVAAPVIRYANASTVATGSYIVVLKKDRAPQAPTGSDFAKAKTDARQRAQAKLKGNAIATDRLEQVFTKALNGFSARLNDEELQRLRLDDDVAYIEEDQIISLAMAPPGGKGGGGGGSSPAQTVPYGITRVNGGTSGSGTGRAYVIDSGIDLDHEDLNVNVALSASFLTRGDANDENGHGTHVAGTIAALDNEIGVIGVAPGAEVVSVRVLDRRGSGSTSGVISGVDYVMNTASSRDVANMSLGGGISTALDDAVIAASATCPFVLAAGNSSADANTSSPARAEGANIYTISAMDSNDNFASFSNFGSPVDYAAPGVGVNSTYKDGGYASLSGTSMASPHAAGVILLGGFRTDGFVKNDPDGDPDPIIVH